MNLIIEVINYLVENVSLTNVVGYAQTTRCALIREGSRNNCTSTNIYKMPLQKKNITRSRHCLKS